MYIASVLAIIVFRVEVIRSQEVVCPGDGVKHPSRYLCSSSNPCPALWSCYENYACCVSLTVLKNSARDAAVSNFNIDSSQQNYPPKPNNVAQPNVAVSGKNQEVYPPTSSPVVEGQSSSKENKEYPRKTIDEPVVNPSIPPSVSQKPNVEPSIDEPPSGQHSPRPQGNASLEPSQQISGVDITPPTGRYMPPTGFPVGTPQLPVSQPGVFVEQKSPVTELPPQGIYPPTPKPDLPVEMQTSRVELVATPPGYPPEPGSQTGVKVVQPKPNTEQPPPLAYSNQPGLSVEQRPASTTSQDGQTFVPTDTATGSSREPVSATETNAGLSLTPNSSPIPSESGPTIVETTNSIKAISTPVLETDKGSSFSGETRSTATAGGSSIGGETVSAAQSAETLSRQSTTRSNIGSPPSEPVSVDKRVSTSSVSGMPMHPSDSRERVSPTEATYVSSDKTPSASHSILTTESSRGSLPSEFSISAEITLFSNGKSVTNSTDTARSKTTEHKSSGESNASNPSGSQSATKNLLETTTKLSNPVPTVAPGGLQSVTEPDSSVFSKEGVAVNSNTKSGVDSSGELKSTVGQGGSNEMQHFTPAGNFPSGQSPYGGRRFKLVPK